MALVLTLMKIIYKQSKKEPAFNSTVSNTQSDKKKTTLNMIKFQSEI